MKGIIIKREEQWGVLDNQSGEFLCLHPDDVNEITELHLIFDNPESRIFASPEVHYEKVSNQKMSGISVYAKLKKNKK